MSLCVRPPLPLPRRVEIGQGRVRILMGGLPLLELWHAPLQSRQRRSGLIASLGSMTEGFYPIPGGVGVREAVGGLQHQRLPLHPTEVARPPSSVGRLSLPCGPGPGCEVCGSGTRRPC